MGKLYLPKTVDVALSERLDWVFDHYERIVVSSSGGKDSSVLFDAAQKKAKEKGRVIDLFFLDQEAEYKATVELMREQMATGDHVRQHWFQVPIRMTNATSYSADMLNAWHPDEKWMRDKEPNSIQHAPGAPDRFYPFLEWWEAQWGADTAFLVGLRAEESLNRYGAVTRNPAVEGVNWSSKGKGATRFYPLYDWTFEDIWTYLGKEKVSYNKAYDFMWAKGMGIHDMRVSNLIHEKSFQALGWLQQFEHDTYDAMLERLDGVHVAARYAGESTVFNTRQRPPAYKTWLDYRDFLLQTIPPEHKPVFDKRFGNQGKNELIYRQQCRQLLLNDWENNIPVVHQEAPNVDKLLKWRDIL